MEENKERKELINKKIITSISDYLTVLKKEVQEVHIENERFFRGLSKTKYIGTDFPSIYRSPDNNSDYEPYIKYEHEMFYDLVSRFPEQFSSCKNTFEHLVMMQHYGLPTRLLDVTSNPLVALYFACVDRNGTVNDDSDGAVTIYDIPNQQIKNYNSDTVTVLSNLARIDEKYTCFNSIYNSFIKKMNQRIENQYSIAGSIIPKIFKDFNDMISIHNEIGKTDGYLAKNNNKRMKYLNVLKQNYLDTLSYYHSLNAYEEDCTNDGNFEYLGPEEEKIEFLKAQENLNKSLNEFIQLVKKFDKTYPYKEDIKFQHLIKEEKSYFLHENIKSADLTGIYCIKPKLNNPRITNQSGAFLLFGFANLHDTKLIPSIQHFQLKAKKKNRKSTINIIIPKESKDNLVKELRLVGIHRAFLFPEIDKVAESVVNEYKIAKTYS